MLSTPTPNLPITLQFLADLITLSVTLAKQVKIPSTSLAKSIKVSSFPSGATIRSMPCWANTFFSGSVEGHT